MAENDLAAKIGSMIFDAALKASTSEYVVDGVEAVDRIATSARNLVGAMEAENARRQSDINQLLVMKADLEGMISEDEKTIAARDARIVELVEALSSLLDSARDQTVSDGNMVAVLLNGPIVSQSAIEKARAALSSSGKKAASPSGGVEMVAGEEIRRGDAVTLRDGKVYRAVPEDEHD